MADRKKIGSAYVEVEADTRKLQSGLAKAQQNVGRSASQMSQSFSQIGTIAGGTFLGAAALGAVDKLTSAMTGFVRGSINAASAVEDLGVSFTVLLGSADKAAQLIRDLQVFAQTTPFELQELSQGARQLTAFGFSAAEIVPTLRMLGDLASGTGANLQDLVFVFGQTRAEYRVMTRDLRQFTARGIPVIAALAKHFGIAESKVFDLAESGQITFPLMQKLLRDLTSEGGKFFNLMEKRAKTTSGRMSNLADASFKVSAAFGEIFIDAVGLNSILASVTDSLDGLALKLEEIAQRRSDIKELEEIVARFPKAAAEAGLTGFGLSGAIAGGPEALKEALDKAREIAKAQEAQMDVGRVDVFREQINGIRQQTTQVVLETKKVIKSVKEQKEGITEAFVEGKISLQEYKDQMSTLPDLTKSSTEELERLLEEAKISNEDFADAWSKNMNKMAKETKAATTQMSLDIRDLQGSFENFVISAINARLSAQMNKTFGGILNAGFDAIFGTLGGEGPTFDFPSLSDIGSSLFGMGASAVPADAMAGAAASAAPQVINNNTFSSVGAVTRNEMLQFGQDIKQTTMEGVGQMLQRPGAFGRPLR